MSDRGEGSLPSKVLIANRGEIAVRITRTLHELGLAVVVVYHALDRDSLAVHQADEAVELFGDPPVSAYLDGPAILEAAFQTGAEAIHPGYGFLSENADFAESVIDGGLTFVGPRAEAIRAMGDKIESKRLAKLAGVPTLPGSEGALGSVEEAVAEAERIGYPVLLKASAGGGGKGMRSARDTDECRDAFVRASQEAQAAFGDGRVFVERYIERPRHIEVQVLADSRGNVLHLGERECSIQRRYQKVIEESPSPHIDSVTRTEMGDRAVALARAVDYVSAGTVEMVADADQNFYFLEMNTRLQVEHPVTELVTGIDIVAEQLRIAAGEPLSFTQDEVHLSGHAIECRVYAEDTDHDFSPASGPLCLVRFASGPGVRVDHGVRQGQRVTSAFDPMIAKVVGYGDTREAALGNARAALRDTVLLGTITNTAFLERVLAHPKFVAGETHTAFLDDYAELSVTPPADEAEQRVLLSAAALASPRYDRRFTLCEPLASLGAWRP
jgi:acetyl-CoA carboxylase biotin carboxylase subunit